MNIEPRIVRRAAQPYVGIRMPVTMDTIAHAADRMPEVFAWLAGRGIVPADSPFFRYLVVDMAATLLVEVGVPIAEPVDGEGDVAYGVLPAGQYAVVTHVGHPMELRGVTHDLLAWASAQGLAWDMHPTDRGEEWACRLEVYHTDPAVEPDLAKWETDLAFRLAD